MDEPARLATMAVSLPAASERLDIENSDTAPNRPTRKRASLASASSQSPGSESPDACADAAARWRSCESLHPTHVRRRGRISPMTDDTGADVLDLRELFAVPWEGEATLWRPLWTRWIPAPRTFRFRSEITNLARDSWDVVDTTTYPNGRIEQRRMRAHQVSPTQISLEADDMPDGGLTDDGQTLVDSLEMRFLGILVGRVTMRLKRTSEAG